MQSKATNFKRAALVCSAALVAALAARNEAWAQYDPGQSNLALGKTATSGENDFGGTPDKGVDGIRDGNFGDGSVYYGNANATNGLYYQVDLGANQYVNRIQFLPRTDTFVQGQGYQNVFGNLNISIFPDNGSGQPAAVPSYSQNFNTNGHFGPEFATALPGMAAPGGANGRFVKITRIDNNFWLTFAEMEVVGSSTPLTHTLSNDIALGKPVTLAPGDSAGFGATNASGNDGDINGDFGAPNQGTTGNAGTPVFHTNNHGGTNAVYWQVDLGANTALSYANLMARMDTNSTSQFDLEVYDSSMNLVDSVLVNNSDVLGTTPGYDHAVDLTGVTGQFIRVTPGPAAGDSYLSFSELQVFAATVPEPSTLVLAGPGLFALMGSSRANRRADTVEI